ncbi:cytochrome P450 [Mycena belliarum]|uniref:Cytochrome P450 n=1 Tax=Mycena belliarum TaxID=1033014 RepID=A0AAD6TSD7_9AGAR|nr:cytochrome P450 [Mycena belliae]
MAVLSFPPHAFGAIWLSLSFYILLAVRNLIYRPSALRSVPGPLLAACTHWYTAYFDLVRDGGFLKHLEWLHEKYGPVVRIGPNEADPDAFDSIYGAHSTFVKDPVLYKAFQQDLSSFGLLDPREARKRREILSPLFSRRATLKLEHVIQQKVDKLINRVLRYEGNSPCNIFMAVRSTTLDIIASYCFAQSFDTMDHPEFRHPILLAILSGISVIWTLKYFPFLYYLSERAPGWLMHRISPVSKGYTELFAFLSRHLDSILADPTKLDVADHETIFHHLLHPSTKQHNIPSRKSLLDESLTLLGAGSETVGNVVTTGVFHVFRNKHISNRLMMELDAAWPDRSHSVGFQSLEKLPYLTAVIKESIRMAGVATPLPRVVGPSDVCISGYTMPAGTVVSLGITFVHENRKIFEEPDCFLPERWLGAISKEMESKYFVPFSRGPRMCLGMNLAWCELYLLFGHLFRKIEMEVHNTGIEDFEYRQHWLPVYRKRQLHTRVRTRQ